MTAAHTPRLALMSPTNSDDFTPDDFVDTFTKLDGRPGILPVANYAALPTGLTSANHGSIYLQSDNGSLWQWNRPGAPAGSWRKLNTVGQIAYGAQASQVSTSTTIEANGPSILNLTYTAPGGRPLALFFSHYTVSNSGSLGYSRCALWHDDTIVERSNAAAGAPNHGIAHRMLQVLGPPVPGSTHHVKITIASSSSAGGGTTTAATAGQLYIWEF